MTDTITLNIPATHACKVRRTSSGLYVITFGKLIVCMPNVFGFDLVVYISREHTHHIVLSKGHFFCDDIPIKVTNDK